MLTDRVRALTASVRVRPSVLPSLRCTPARPCAQADEASTATDSKARALEAQLASTQALLVESRAAMQSMQQSHDALTAHFDDLRVLLADVSATRRHRLRPAHAPWLLPRAQTQADRDTLAAALAVAKGEVAAITEKFAVLEASSVQSNASLAAKSKEVRDLTVQLETAREQAAKAATEVKQARLAFESELQTRMQVCIVSRVLHIDRAPVLRCPCPQDALGQQAAAFEKVCVPVSVSGCATLELASMVACCRRCS